MSDIVSQLSGAMNSPNGWTMPQMGGATEPDDRITTLLKPQDQNKANSLSPEDKTKILSKLDKMFNAARNARIPFERQWYMNMAFYFGRQYVVWAPGSQGTLTRLYEPNAPQWRVRLVINKIRPSVRFELTKMCKEQPTMFVIPGSTADEDIAAARAAEQIVEYELRELDYNRIVRRTVFWMLICGSAFMKTYYDDEQKDPSGVPGRIIVEPVNPFHVFVPLVQEDEIENQPYVIHAMLKPKEWADWRFGKNLNASSSSGTGVLEQQFLTALGVNSRMSSQQVYIKEAWIKPCKDYPDGALASWCDGELLSLYDTWPYDNLDFPFAKLDHLPTGRFYGESTITDMIPLQRELNRTRSQIVEAKNRMAKPQLVAPKGSIDVNKITSEPGLVILYTPGFNPPQPIPLSPLPAYVEDELQRIQQDIQEQSASYDIPRGVISASAIAYIQEAHDTRFASAISSIEEATEKVGQQILGYVAQYWDVERKINVTGDNNIYEAYAYSKASIRDNTDLRVEAGSAQPRSLAAKQAFITEIGKLGWISPEKALRYMDMAETGKMYEESQIDARQVQRENAKMSSTGQTLPINEWDNDQEHEANHANYMKTQEFEKLDPQVQQALVEHLQLHRSRMQTNMQQAQMAQGQMPPQAPQEMGAPPG
jgi:hypothetical protein